MKREGFVLWTIANAGIVIWMLHATSTSALTSAACTHSWASAVTNLDTLVTAVLCAAALVWCYVYARGVPVEVGDQPDPPTRLHFACWYGVLVNAISLVLIVTEGAYLPSLAHCGIRGSA